MRDPKPSTTLLLLVALLAAVAALFTAPVVHAATTLTGINVPRRIALATTQTRIDFPRSTDYLRVEVPTGETVYYEVDCTDGAALGTHYETWAGGVTYVRAVDAGFDVCLAAASGTPTVAVTPLTRGK